MVEMDCEMPWGRESHHILLRSGAGRRRPRTHPVAPRLRAPHALRWPHRRAGQRAYYEVCTEPKFSKWYKRSLCPPAKIESPLASFHNPRGGARGPVILPNFKLGDPSLRGRDGGFDSHTPPPIY